MPLQRLDRLAIIIVGEQNSGKTTTLKSYCDYYYEFVNTFKPGWRRTVVPFRPKFETIKIIPFVLPWSPTEKKIPLAKTINIKWLPDVLLMAEQFNGAEYSNTVHFLMKHEYYIKEFNLSNVEGDGVWDRWKKGNKLQEDGKIIQRREEVAECIRQFLLSKAS
jgi:hypothetical protein